MGLSSSRGQPRTRVGGYSILLDLYPKHRGTAPGFLCRRRCDTNNPALLPLVRSPLPQRESTTVDLNEAVVGEIAGQRQGATSRVVARHTGTVSVTHATIDLVKPPGRLISPLSACTNASRLSATPRCPMLWCLADLCRCPVGLLGSACSSGRQGQGDHLAPPTLCLRRLASDTELRLTYEMPVTRLFRDRLQFCSGLVDLVVCVSRHGGGGHRFALCGRALAKTLSG
jgi:hypothetical protein